MADFLLVVIAAFVAAGIVFGIAVLATGGDPGLAPSDPDRRPRMLPRDRPLVEPDVSAVRFDTVLRGYRMADVDETLRRLGYDLGYKSELIRVMEAELSALRAGELDQANELRRMRMAALGKVDAVAGDDAERDGEGQDGGEAEAESQAAEADMLETVAADEGERDEPGEDEPSVEAASEEGEEPSGAGVDTPDNGAKAPSGDQDADVPGGTPSGERDGVGSPRR